jgi:hypothetical protein
MGRSFRELLVWFGFGSPEHRAKTKPAASLAIEIRRPHEVRRLVCEECGAHTVAPSEAGVRCGTCDSGRLQPLD